MRGSSGGITGAAYMPPGRGVDAASEKCTCITRQSPSSLWNTIVERVMCSLPYRRGPTGGSSPTQSERVWRWHQITASSSETTIEAGVDIEVFVQSFQQTPAVLRRAADQLGFLYRCVCHYREPKQKAESRIMMPRHRPSPPLNSDAPLMTLHGPGQS